MGYHIPKRNHNYMVGNDPFECPEGAILTGAVLCGRATSKKFDKVLGMSSDKVTVTVKPVSIGFCYKHSLEFEEDQAHLKGLFIRQLNKFCIPFGVSRETVSELLDILKHCHVAPIDFRQLRLDIIKEKCEEYLSHNPGGE